MNGVFIMEEIQSFYNDEDTLEKVNLEMDEFLDEIHEQVNIVYEGLKLPELEEKLKIFQATSRAIRPIDPVYADELLDYCRELSQKVQSSSQKQSRKQSLAF